MKFHYLFALPMLSLVLPAHAETDVQELQYQSAFEGYQAYSDPDIQDWSTVNNVVGEIGGWKVYAREPYEENSAGEKEKSPPADPHRQHGGGQ